ncbi:MAG: glycosyltransferase family 4 protein [Novibacillus thermophilus]
MKVLLATFWNDSLASGVTSYIRQLKQGLERQGHEVGLCAQRNRQVFHVDCTGHEVYQVQLPRLFSLKLNDTYSRHFPYIDPWVMKYERDRYEYELSALSFDLTSYDVIHTQDVVSTRAFARIKPKNVPLVATVHGCFTRESGLDRRRSPELWEYYANLERVGVLSADRAIMPTHWLKNLFARDFFIPPEGVTTIPYGMDVHGFRQKVNEATDISVPANKKVIVCSARLTRVKGHYTLIQALYELKKKRKDWVCLFLGDGPLRRQLEHNSRLYGLGEDVQFLGDRLDVPAILGQADIFVLPSLMDNHPFALMEAQVAGTAVVTSDAGGIPEMVSHEETGLISPAGHPKPLAEQMNRLLSDRPLRQRLSQKARIWGEQAWNMEAMLKRITQVYETVLSKGGSGVQTQDPFKGVPFTVDLTKLGVDTKVWRNIIESLPENYRIPDPAFVQLLQKYGRKGSRHVKK